MKQLTKSKTIRFSENQMNSLTILEEFYKITGCPILLNTSLNVAGKPLAGYTENAKEIFLKTKLDCMFIGNEYYSKEYQ
jgi:carbamoyltransferase